MIIRNLYAKQSELDTFITERRGLQNENLLEKKCVALQCELWEFLNEVGKFKYWKDQRSNKRMLDEGIDILHFLLSIGNELKLVVNNTSYMPKKRANHLFENELKIANESSRLLNEILMYHDDKDRYSFAHAAYAQLVDFWYTLMKNTGFKDYELTEAYQEKYQVNIKRQTDGY